MNENVELSVRLPKKLHTRLARLAACHVPYLSLNSLITIALQEWASGPVPEVQR